MTRKLRLIAIAAILLLFGSCASAHADDTFMTGESGAATPMHRSPTIQMVSELVRIKLPEGRVEASFLFRNTGSATTVTIGFPEWGRADENGNEPYTSMLHFRSWVDGVPIHVRRVPSRTMGDDEPDAYYDARWIKRVHFAAGQARTVRDTYSGGLFYSDEIGAGYCGFYYVLVTGSSWHGVIGDARIVCDVSRLRDCAPIYFQPEGGRRDGDTISWDIRNFKPNRDVIIGWNPTFEAVDVNGEPIWRYKNATEHGRQVYDPTAGIWPDQIGGWEDPILGNELPKRTGDDIWLPTLVAASWLGANSTFADGRIRIRCHGGSAFVTPGSPVLESSEGGRISMRRKATAIETETVQNSEQGDDIYDLRVKTSYVFLRPLVAALGGTSYWDRRDNRLMIWLPQGHSGRR